MSQNKKLLNAVKKLTFDPDKKYVLVLNNRQTTVEDAVDLLEVLKKDGYSQTTVLLVDGDVRSAAKAYKVEDIKKDENEQSNK